jgi:dTDP-L-rhamnose 4-epimerase
MSKNVLITGGAGFVGSHLADGLLREGNIVRVLDNLTPQVHQNTLPTYLSPKVEIIYGDVRDRDVLLHALKDIDVVFHFAAAVGVGQSMYEISRYMEVNTIGTAQLLQVLLDSKVSLQKLIVASSMSIYGEGRYNCATCGPVAPPIRTNIQLRSGKWDISCPICGNLVTPSPTSEDKPSAVTSVYALSKRDQEELCLVFGRTYDVPVVALRFFNIYGTRQALSNPYTGVAAIFASRLLNDQPPLIFEDGNQLRDFVSIHDIVRANLLAMKRSQANGQIINVGSGQPIKISKVAELLSCALGKDIKPVVTRQYRSGDIRHCYADLTRAREVLGYEPRVSHLEGFRELVDWLQQQHAEDNAEIAMKELKTYGLSA